MAETVHTGGLNTFVRPKGHYPKPSKEFMIEIEEAYDRARERKKKEKKRKILILFVAILILLVLGVWWFLSR